MFINRLFMSTHKTRLRIGIAIAVVIALSCCVLHWVESRSPKTSVSPEDVRDFVLNGDDWPEPKRRALSDLVQLEPGLLGRVVAADAKKFDGAQWDRIIELVQALPEVDRADVVQTLLVCGDQSFAANRMTAAERCFTRLLAVRPSHSIARTRIAFLQACEGRRWESTPHLIQLLRQGQTSIELLLWLSNLQITIGDEQQLNSWIEAERDSKRTLASGARLGLSRLAIEQNRATEVLADLSDLSRAAFSPGRDRIDEAIVREASVQKGVVLLSLLETPRPDKSANDRREPLQQWDNWHRALDDIDEQHPDVWVTRGRWLIIQEDRLGAVRCFAEAVQLDPDHRLANYRLAQTLLGMLQDEPKKSSLGERDRALAQACLDRVSALDEVFRLANLIHDNRTDVSLMRRMSELTEQLGRLWEAWGWCRAIQTIEPQSEWAWAAGQRLRTRLDQENPPRVLASSAPTHAWDWTPFPRPNWQRPYQILRVDIPSIEAPQVPFIEEEAGRGLGFSYFNSGGLTRGKRSFEFTGGGIGCLDFDQDGWPDVWLTQGCLWPEGRRTPPEPGQREHLDRLFRNVGGERFEDVTGLTGVVEDLYSQGIAVGDYDNDGFPDVYVANIGRNRFFRNNGDGTFDDVTEATATAGNEWSTSCVLADLNADGLPDLYVVNYLQGDDVFERLCRDADGTPRLCFPQAFSAAADRLYLNRGDGSFEDATDSLPHRDTAGRGLGVVAADFEQTGRLGLFVANDTTANYYLRRRDAGSGKAGAFEEAGVISGLAFDQNGKAQAGMGVAVADVDRDGRLDVFVTNFEKEFNSLYLQKLPGLFVDSIASSGMRDASYPMLGFGTQFLDGDLDGRPDLFVANGHIDDFTRQGSPYRMPAQFFRNVGEGRFQEVAGTKQRLYFDRKHLGRAAAKLDWNRDGGEDLIVAHLDEPTALLTHRNESHGRQVVLTLRGVPSGRDAIGTRVIVEAVGLGRIVHQLTAGDGYQASNERRLVIGLGPVPKIARLRIEWPSGTTLEASDIPARTSWRAIEGEPGLHRFPVE